MRRIYLIITVFTVLSLGTGAVFATNTHKSTSKVASDVKSASTTPDTSETPLTTSKPIETVPAAPVTPVEAQQTAPSAPTPDQNKQKLKDYVTNLAISHGITGDQLAAQFICVNKMLSSEGYNYDDYDKLFTSPVMIEYTDPFHSSDGVTIGYHYFDYQGSCSLFSEPRY